VETVSEKTACFEICQISGHSCYGGYLNEVPMCDEEIVRMKSILELRCNSVTFRATVKEGLYFVCGKVVVQNDNGMWTQRDKPIKKW
jgi:hypothetical protein